MAPLDENMKKELVNLMVRRKLAKVVDAYVIHPEVRQLKIPRTGDTALHVVVTDEREIYAQEMVSAAGRDVLAIGNEQGDTPLHLAARFGNTYLCQCIAQKDLALITEVNKFGETPLISAASRGKTQAFLYLHHLAKDNQIESDTYTTRNNGDTILHSAISQDYFDLAYIIIKEYPKLVHLPNKNGLSPLHLLATKPSAFPSGVQFFGIRKLVHQCVRVQKLAKMPDLAKAPNPQPSWSPFMLKVLNFLSTRDIFTGSTLRVDHQNNQQDEESTNSQGHGEIDQQDEEAANKQDDYGIKPGFALCLGLSLLFFWPIYLGIFVCIYCPYVLLRITFVLAKNIFGYEEYARIKHIKKICAWSVEVMNNLIESEHADQSVEATIKIVEYPIFMAAKHGISEMVLRILDVNPEAIFEVNAEKKNIVMLAVEYRHHRLYDDLLDNMWIINRTILEHVDKDGNTLLHIAANLEEGQQFWRIRGAALHMHMEIKWYEFVKKSMPPYVIDCYNNDHKTPREIFQDSHRPLITDARQWLTDTSQSCSVVAALIATVAFATSATIPGGLKQDNGVPSLEHKPFFILSACSSLVALSFSMISVVMFLGILTSSFDLKDFRTDLPYKLLLGLVSLLFSIVSMIVSFYAGHYFVLKQESIHNAALVYDLLCSFLLVFIILKFPLDFELVWTTLRTKPFK